jgi:hypothetical protein
MMKSLTIHIALAVLGLASAYYVWTAGEPTEESPEGVTLLECAPERLTSVRFESERRDVTLESRGERDDRAFWVRVLRKSSSAAPTPPEGEREDGDVVEFVASAEVDEYVKTIAPFKAIRSLGDVDDETLSDLGLGDGAAHMTISCGGGRELALDVGESTFGTGDRYARRADGGPVFLLNGEIVRGLESAELQLMQRDLHRFEMTEVARLEVEAFGESRTLLQRNHRTPEQAEWVDSADPDRRNELYGNWLDRLSRLRVQSYLPLDAAPGSDLDGESATSVRVLTLRYLGDDGEEIGKLELEKVEYQPPVYYARSEATRAWVRVVATTAREVEDDARPVVGLPAIERAPETPAEGAAPGALSPLEPAQPIEPISPHAHPLPMPSPHAAPMPAPAAPAPAAPAGSPATMRAAPAAPAPATMRAAPPEETDAPRPTMGRASEEAE